MYCDVWKGKWRKWQRRSPPDSERLEPSFWIRSGGAQSAGERGRWIRVCQRFQLDAADDADDADNAGNADDADDAGNADNADDADERQTTPRDVGDQWSEKRSDAPAQNGGLCFPRAVEKEEKEEREEKEEEKKEEEEEEEKEKEEELIQADRPNI